MAVEVGQEAPDFTLSSFRGRKNVVLVFYPGAFSGVCTRQLTEVQDSSARYAEGDAQVIGVSVDSCHSQGAFARHLGLTDAILLADFHPKGAVARAYGVWLEQFGFAARATFVIDKQGVVRGVTLTDNPGQIPDEDTYFAALSTCSP